jgi:predicted membrane channel-forming protein YqfA (hemolysin III family)
MSTKLMYTSRKDTSTYWGFQEMQTKPLLRGASHQHAIFAALAAGILLIASAHSKEAKLSCAVYITSLVVLFTASTIYHRYSICPFSLTI